MSTITSKYAVPFNNRKSIVLDNVMTQKIDGGTGYLNIVLPVIPSTDNSIGFKIRVYDDKYSPSIDSDPLFECHISGNSSDGYRWLYVSSVQNENFIINRKPVLFCSRLVKEDNYDVQYIKSVVIGDPDTKWGDKITVVIEYVSATLKTTPDKEMDKKYLSDIAEFSSLSSKASGKWNEGWRFYVSDKLSEETTVDATINPKELREGGDIEATGVISGESIEEDGKIKILTRFTNNRIDLGRGQIIADGSKLINLPDNDGLKSWTPNQALKLANEVTLSSISTADVNLSFTFDGSKNVSNDVSIRKFVVGTWNSANKNRILSPKSTSSKDVLSDTEVTLRDGELGSFLSTNSELLIGNGGKNVLVGRVDIIYEDEIPTSYEIEGKAILHKGTFKVYSNGVGWKELEIDASKLSVSMDTIIDGQSYKKVVAGSISEGNVNRLFVSSGKTLEGSTIYGHLSDKEVHVTSEDKTRWDALYNSEPYSKVDADELLRGKSDTDHYHSRHNNVVKVLESAPYLSNEFSKGDRVLIKNEAIIKTADGDSRWLKDEPLSDGDTVLSIEEGEDKYKEWINKNGSIELNVEPPSELPSSIFDFNPLAKNYISLKEHDNKLTVDNWRLLNNKGNCIIQSVKNSINVGDGLVAVSIKSSTRPTWNNTGLSTLNDIDALNKEYSSINHNHKFHDSILGVRSEFIEDPYKGDRYIVNNNIFMWDGSSWKKEESNEGDVTYDSSTGSLLKYSVSKWTELIKPYLSSEDSSIKIDNDEFKIGHTNSVEPKSGLLHISYDSTGHITSSRNIESSDLPMISSDNLLGTISESILPSPYIGLNPEYERKKGAVSIGRGVSLDVSVKDDEIKYNDSLIVDHLPSNEKYRPILKVEDEDGDISYSWSKEEFKVPGTPNNYTMTKGLKYNIVSGDSTGIKFLSGIENLDMIQLDNSYSDVNSVFIDRNSSNAYLATGKSNEDKWKSVKSLGMSINRYSSEPDSDTSDSLPIGSLCIVTDYYKE